MESHVVLPTRKHSHTIVFLHGRDSTATEFASEFFESQASNDRTFTSIFPSIKWVFPKARLRISARFETEMSQWFDMWSVEHPLARKDIQIPGLLESVKDILDIIRVETEQVRLERIILAGISQGCATAIISLLLGNIQVGAFIGLCSWLPFSDNFIDISRSLSSSSATSGSDSAPIFLSQKLQKIQRIFRVKSDNGEDTPSLPTLSIALKGDNSPETTSIFDTPILLSHSQDDEVVPIDNGRTSRDILRLLGFANLEWKEYENGRHWINEPQGVDDIATFLQKHLDCLEDSQTS